MGDVADSICERVAEIRKLLGDHSTSSVVGWCWSFNVQAANELDWHKVLHSPARQLSFMLGLLLGSPEPASPKELGGEEWRQVLSLLNEAFNQYQSLYYPSRTEAKDLGADWWRARDVAMPAFFHYGFNDLMASPEQVEARIATYLTPFDEVIGTDWGLGPLEASAIARWISDRLQRSLDLFMDLRDEVESARDDLLGRGDTIQTIDAAKDALAEDYPDLGTRLSAALEDLGCIRFEDLEASFPESARAFWEEFTVERGQGTSVEFPTERTVFDERPLILKSQSIAMCPSINAVFTAVLRRGEELLQNGPSSESYYRQRDKALEDEAAELFSRWFGEGATCLRGLYETQNQSFEHDLIVVSDGRCLVVECKATPPKEPFRDPERAFVRLTRAFRSETGIQHAFDQANRVCRRVRAGDRVTLYDDAGEAVVSLSSEELDSIYAVCVTRDDYGPLATNLSLLLDKEDDDPFPWVVNVFDMQALCEAKEYFSLPSSYLMHYLDERLPLNGRAWTTDELDIFAFRLKHGTLDWVRKTDADFFVVDPSYANLFDEIYRAKSFDGPPVRLEPKPPVISDMRASLEAGSLVTVPNLNVVEKVPRNAPCPCGSGRKSKRCCGHPRNR